MVAPYKKKNIVFESVSPQASFSKILNDKINHDIKGVKIKSISQDEGSIRWGI